MCSAFCIIPPCFAISKGLGGKKSPVCPRPQPHATPSPLAPSPCPVSDGQLVALLVSPALSASAVPPVCHPAVPTTSSRSKGEAGFMPRASTKRAGQGSASRSQLHGAPCRASSSLPAPTGSQHRAWSPCSAPRPSWRSARGRCRAGRASLGTSPTGWSERAVTWPRVGGCKSEQFKPLTLIVTKMRKQETLPAESKAVKCPLLSHRDLSEVFPGDACLGAAHCGCRGQGVHGPFQKLPSPQGHPAPRCCSHLFLACF